MIFPMLFKGTPTPASVFMVEGRMSGRSTVSLQSELHTSCTARDGVGDGGGHVACCWPGVFIYTCVCVCACVCINGVLLLMFWCEGDKSISPVRGYLNVLSHIE